MAALRPLSLSCGLLVKTGGRRGLFEGFWMGFAVRYIGGLIVAGIALAAIDAATFLLLS